MDIAELWEHIHKLEGKTIKTLGPERRPIKIIRVSNDNIEVQSSGPKEGIWNISRDRIEDHWRYLIENRRLSHQERPEPLSRSFSYVPAILSRIRGIKVETNPIVLYWRR